MHAYFWPFMSTHSVINVFTRIEFNYEKFHISKLNSRVTEKLSEER